MTDETANLPALMTAPAPMTGSMFDSPAMLEHTQRVSKLFMASALAPEHLRKNMSDVVIAIDIARQMGESPIAVMQNIYFVSGRAGWKTEYMIARANRSGVFKGRITWKTAGEGAAMVVTAHAALADTGEVVEAAASMAMAQAEGWVKNPKYKTMPEHMLRWRSATMLIRLYAPEVMLGAQTMDEIDDMRHAGQLSAQPDGSYAPASSAELRAAADDPLAIPPELDRRPKPAQAEPDDDPELPAPAAAAEPPEAEPEATPAAATAPKPATTPQEWPGFVQGFLKELMGKATVAEIEVHLKTPKLQKRLAEVETWEDGDARLAAFWETVEDIKAEKADG